MINEKAVALAIAREMHKGGDFGLDGDSAYEARPSEFLALARAAIAALSPGSTGSAEGWQDIATAPKDGTPILLGYLDKSGKFAARSGSWMADIYHGREWKPFGAWVCTMDTVLLDQRGSHWRPLPAPPSAMIDAAGGRDE